MYLYKVNNRNTTIEGMKYGKKLTIKTSERRQ